MSETVKLTIDGTAVEVPKGTRVIEAAKKAKTPDIPFYCYHPGLSVAGNCRMCLVQIEKMPKLQIACHTTVQEGMVVNTQSQIVKDTRKHVLEFLLVNHPVDCPVCDQAGECWLQDYYMNYGAYQSKLNENKIKKEKARSIGPHVMLDQERCILCSRCVRFTDEISKTHELGITERGDHSEIELFPGTELDNNYSGNVVDLCPVGALTDKDFRFKMRVWYLKSEDTLCNGCSRGCNIQMHYKTERPHHAHGERVIRLKPRYNERVNQWWICDEGRYGYKFHDHNRIMKPLRRLKKEVKELSWEDSLIEVAGLLNAAQGKFGVLVSPQLSNEDIYIIKKLFAEELGSKNLVLVSPTEDGFEDEFLIKADKNPNSKGAEFQGLNYDESALNELLKKSESGELDGLIIFGQDILGRNDLKIKQTQLQGLKWTVFIGSNSNLTSEYGCYVLPSATYAEKEGTFTNFQGLTQKFDQVLLPLGDAKADWQIVVELAKKLGVHMHFDQAEELLKELAIRNKNFEGLNYEILATKGATVDDMAMPMIPRLEQDSGLIFYNANPDQTQKIIDDPKPEEVKSV